MTEAEALEAIRGYASANRIQVIGHPIDRADERTVQYGDLRHALVNASRCKLQPNGRWRVDGKDLDGDDLTIIVIIRDGVIVVTVF